MAETLQSSHKKQIIATWLFALGSIVLFMLNWNEYSLYQTVVNYNDLIYALVITAVFILYFADIFFKIIKSDKVFWLVAGINIAAFVLLLIGGRGVRTFVLLYDLTISLYIAYKSQVSLKLSKSPGIMSVLLAGFFIYWTIDVKGYFKGYSINYGGLVLLSGFVFLIIVAEYLKARFLQIKSEHRVISFIQNHRFYITFLETGLFFVAWKIMSWYRSRTAFFAMLIFAILIIIPWEIIRKKVVYYFVTVASIVGGILVPVLYLYIGGIVSNTEDYMLFYKPLFSERMHIWPQLFELIKAFPITGIGVLYMNDAPPYRDGMLDTCNSFINLYVYYGVMVATLVVVLLTIVILKMYDSVNKNPLAKVAYSGVISFTVASYFESFFTTVPFMVVYVFSIMMIRSLSEERFDYSTETEYYKGLFKTDFKKRFVTAFVSVFALIFMYFIFGPIEIYYANIDEYVFNMSSFAKILIPVSIAFAIALSLIIASMPEMVANIVAAVVSGLTMASYVQYMFFNEDLVDEYGNFTNAKELGAEYYVSISLFFIIWIVISIVGILIKNKKHLLVLPAAITVIQTVALISILIPILMMPKKSHYIRIFDSSSEFDVGKEENIIVLVLDTFSRNFFEEINEMWPNRIEALHDFTYYENADSKYAHTFPSIVHMITTAEWDGVSGRREYEREAFESAECIELFDTLHSNGYEATMYTTDIIMDSYLDDLYSNVKIVRKTDNIEAIVEIILNQVGYRYAPYCIKPMFYWTADEINLSYAYENEESYYFNYSAYNHLNENGIEIDESSDRKFKYLHFEGAHSGAFSDEECNRINMGDASQTCNAAGSLKMADRYLDELKIVGKYDDSTIIIMADHGNGENTNKPIFLIKRKGETHDKMEINSSEFEYCEFNDLIKTLVITN